MRNVPQPVCGIGTSDVMAHAGQQMFRVGPSLAVCPFQLDRGAGSVRATVFDRSRAGSESATWGTRDKWRVHFSLSPIGFQIHACLSQHRPAEECANESQE